MLYHKVFDDFMHLQLFGLLLIKTGNDGESVAVRITGGSGSGATGAASGAITAELAAVGLI